MKRPGEPDRRSITRRQVLGAVGGGGTLALAGCSSLFEREDEGSDGPVASLNHIVIQNRTMEAVPVRMTVRKDGDTVYDETVQIDESPAGSMEGTVIDEEPWLGERAAYELHVESPKIDEAVRTDSDEGIGGYDTGAAALDGTCYEYLVEIWGDSYFPEDATDPTAFVIRESVIDPDTHPTPLNGECAAKS